MQPKDLQRFLEKLNNHSENNFKFTVPKLGKLKRVVIKPKDESELRNTIREFQPEQGWMCWQNEVSFFRQSETLAFLEQKLLYGELAKQDAALHINEDGQGKWVVTIFEEKIGDDILIEKTHFLGEPDLAPKELIYHVYWQLLDKQGYRKIAARFVRFKN